MTNKGVSILERIVEEKRRELERLPVRTVLPADLRAAMQQRGPARDFRAALLQPGKGRVSLIAEVKKASPSKGVLRENFDPVEIALAYQQGGASCLSVLTDTKFFQGSFDNLAKVRAVVDLPLLCKEFVISPFQMYWARLQGADAVLLIAAILSDQDLQYFIKMAFRRVLTNY